MEITHEMIKNINKIRIIYNHSYLNYSYFLEDGIGINMDVVCWYALYLGYFSHEIC